VRLSAVCLLAALVAGCAAFDGSGLVPGKSTESEVRALMGPPSQMVELPEGQKALYFSRLPEGRMVFVATVGSDGVLRSLDQRLTRQNIAWLVAGKSTKKDVLGFFGPPGDVGRYPRLEREWWEYKFFDYQDRRILTVQFSDDGVVREVLDMRDWAYEPPGLFGLPGMRR
jgi:hypothetical protein